MEAARAAPYEKRESVHDQYPLHEHVRGASKKKILFFVFNTITPSNKPKL